MENTSTSEIEFELRKLVTRYWPLFDRHQWISEHLRWVELVFALVARISDQSEFDIRAIVEDLDGLDLLGVDTLAEIPRTEGQLDWSYPHARRILEFLAECGFSEQESQGSLLAMHEAASS